MRVVVRAPRLYPTPRRAATTTRALDIASRAAVASPSTRALDRPYPVDAFDGVVAHAAGDAPARARALATLHRVARRAHGLMKRRGWRVGELTELPPAPPGSIALWGDNLDRGRRVRVLVRQRRERGEAAYRWIDEEQVFAVMLHELTHVEIGPHDATFYALLRTLEREAAVMMASDFVVCGRCVGGDGGARRARSPRTNARDAAARRARLAEVGLRGGGRRLGGTARDESRLLAAPGTDDAVVVLDAEADDDAPIVLD